MRVGLVLEGGSMRGLFTSGILDVMLENNIKVDTIIGVSAGALFGANYPSEQIGRAIRYNKNYIGDKRYISTRNLLLTGNIINKKFAFYEMSTKIDPFDNQKFIDSKIDFYATVSNVETGKPEYLKINDPIKDMEILRATSAIPLVSKIVKIDNKKYLDGGATDSIPIEKMLSLNCDKIIVILTQPMDYIKNPLDSKNIKAIKLRYKKYPNFIDALINRHIMYNKELDIIKSLEKQNKIFVMRPKKNINTNILKTTSDMLDEIYQHGIEVGNENINKIKEYLTK